MTGREARETLDVSRKAVRDEDIIGWLNDPAIHIGLVERGLAAYRIEALASALSAARARENQLKEALTRVLEWRMPPRVGYPNPTVESWAIPGWLAKVARAALGDTNVRPGS